MLPQQYRLRQSRLIRATVRHGVRAGKPTLVVHLIDETTPSGLAKSSGTVKKSPRQGGEAPKVGFVVSKSIGNAVTRNRVKRRLRHIVRPLIEQIDRATVRVVVRACPAAVDASHETLVRDFHSAWKSAWRAWDRRQRRERHQGTTEVSASEHDVAVHACSKGEISSGDTERR